MPQISFAGKFYILERKNAHGMNVNRNKYTGKPVSLLKNFIFQKGKKHTELNSIEINILVNQFRCLRWLRYNNTL